MVLSGNMGLEGVYRAQNMESFGEISPFLSGIEASFPNCDFDLRKDGDFAQLISSDLMQQVYF